MKTMLLFLLIAPTALAQSSGNYSRYPVSGSGSVTSITAGSGLSGGTVTTSGTLALALNSLTGGRLSLSSSLPVTTADQTAKTTVYFLPYRGGFITLYNGTNWATYTLPSSTSVAVPSTTSKNFDIFIYDNSGTLTLETVDWTDDSTRATALATQDGVFVKTGATGHRYLGTGRTTGSSGQTEDSASHRFLWNYYNRVIRPVLLQYNASWSYSSTTVRPCNNLTSNRVDNVIGYADSYVHFKVWELTGSGMSTGARMGIGLDSTTVDSAQNTAYASTTFTSGLGVFDSIPSAGYHYYQCVEYNDANANDDRASAFLDGYGEG